MNDCSEAIPLQVSYQLSRRDLRAFAVTHLATNRSLGVYIGFLFAAAGIALWIRISHANPDMPTLLRLAVTICLTLVPAPLIATLLAVYVWFRYSQSNQANVLAPTTATLSEEGLRFQSPMWNCDYRWEGIHLFAVDSRCIRIYVTADAAYLVPLRAFRNGDEFMRFVGFLETHCAGSRKK